MTENSPKLARIFNCKLCDYECSKISDYEKHILTRKHKNNDKSLQNDDKNSPKLAKKFLCDCGKEYKYRQGLHTHRKNCNQNNISICNSNIKSEESEIKILTNLVLDVVKQNQELTQQNSSLTNKIVNIYKNTSNTTITNSSINSNNKTFNLNVFLNEECKDAMNLMDFVDSLKLQLSDLESVGKLGFVEGISNIIIKNLKALDIHKRPVHCSDSKREVMYIKDEDKWEKENEEKNRLRKAIKYVAHKNSKILPEFKAKYPDCGKSESKQLEQYNKLVIEAMGGRGDNDLEKENKIIKNIAKEVVIDKTITI
uniref:C2H2-type domain-containing protein n=1 Tax=viral metagenome TaxID=1070528 RepID=A0A6C0EQU0_9ZZZZ